MNNNCTGDTIELDLLDVNTINPESGQGREKYSLGITTTIQEYKKWRAELEPQSPIEYVGNVGIGVSKDDKYITSLTELEDLETTRSELQPWYDKIGVGWVLILVVVLISILLMGKICNR